MISSPSADLTKIVITFSPGFKSVFPTISTSALFLLGVAVMFNSEISVLSNSIVYSYTFSSNSGFKGNPSIKSSLNFNCSFLSLVTV